MKILVTGASGFIGRQTLEPLRRMGFDVHAVSRGSAVTDTVEWHAADLFDRDAVSRLVTSIRPTHLLHLAWNAVPGEFWTTPENLTWLESSVHLVERFLDGGGRHVVIAGTCAEYASSAAPCIEEVTPIAPTTLYGATKHALHIVARQMCAQRGATLGWGRIFQPFGPFEPEGRVIPSVIRSLLRNVPVQCTSGEQVRDFVYSEDCGLAFAMMSSRCVETSFNIGTGDALPLRDVLTRLADSFGRRDLLRLGALPSRPGEPPAIFAGTERIRSLGWRPRSLAEGLALTMEWWSNRGDEPLS